MRSTTFSTRWATRAGAFCHVHHAALIKLCVLTPGGGGGLKGSAAGLHWQVVAVECRGLASSCPTLGLLVCFQHSGVTPVTQVQFLNSIVITGTELVLHSTVA
jgi:hypothetical protein